VQKGRSTSNVQAGQIGFIILFIYHENKQGINANGTQVMHEKERECDSFTRSNRNLEKR